MAKIAEGVQSVGTYDADRQDEDSSHLPDEDLRSRQNPS